MIDIAIPGDKSISHRSLMLAALATGESRVRRTLVSDDVSATALCLRELGAPIPPISEEMRIEGRGLRWLHSEPSSVFAGVGADAAYVVDHLAGT